MWASEREAEHFPEAPKHRMVRFDDEPTKSEIASSAHVTCVQCPHRPQAKPGSPMEASSPGLRVAVIGRKQIVHSGVAVAVVVVREAAVRSDITNDFLR